MCVCVCVLVCVCVCVCLCMHVCARVCLYDVCIHSCDLHKHLSVMHFSFLSAHDMYTVQYGVCLTNRVT